MGRNVMASDSMHKNITTDSRIIPTTLKHAVVQVVFPIHQWVIDDGKE
jgi:hypothetical protein